MFSLPGRAGISVPAGHLAPQELFGKPWRVGIALNLILVLVESGYGWYANSFMLMADAAHTLSQVLGAVLICAAFNDAAMYSDKPHKGGRQRCVPVICFMSAILLLMAMSLLILQAIQLARIAEGFMPKTTMAVAAFVVLLKGVTAWSFFSVGRQPWHIGDGVFYIATEAKMSMSVVLVAGLYLWEGWNWLDPLVGMGMALAVQAGAFSLLRHRYIL